MDPRTTLDHQAVPLKVLANLHHEQSKFMTAWLHTYIIATSRLQVGHNNCLAAFARDTSRINPRSPFFQAQAGPCIALHDTQTSPYYNLEGARFTCIFTASATASQKLHSKSAARSASTVMSVSQALVSCPAKAKRILWKLRACRTCFPCRGAWTPRAR